MTDKKDVVDVRNPNQGDVPVFTAEDVVKEELTKEELNLIAQLLGQTNVKVADSPPFVALIQKIGRMTEAM